jgi:hypothetical protein
MSERHRHDNGCVRLVRIIPSSAVFIWCLAGAGVFAGCGQKIAVVKETDSPIQVVTKAEYARASDRAHRCRQETTYPAYGLSRVQTVEVAQPDRMHMTVVETGRQPGKREISLIGSIEYIRDADGSWQLAPASGAAYLNALVHPDPAQSVINTQEVEYRWRGWTIAFGGRQEIGGTPTLSYEFVHDDSSLRRTIRTWVGIYDGLPHKQETIDFHKDLGTGESRDTIVCTYGERFKIEAPM